MKDSLLIRKNALKTISRELTIKQSTKLRKVQIPKSHYQYEMLTQTVLNIYKSINMETAPYLITLAVETKTMLEKPNEVGQAELGDFLLLEALHPDFKYPIFTINENLYDKLANTKCDIKSVIIDKPFANCGIIFLPKKSKFSFIVFTVRASHDLSDTELISCLYATNQIGKRGVITLSVTHNVNSLWSSEVSDDYKSAISSTEFIEVNQLIANIFLYQQTIKTNQTILNCSPKYKQKGFGNNGKKYTIPIEIGTDCKVKTIENPSEKGIHASPCTHWRSGHWRQQLTGSRQTPEFKTIWIEPTLVNL